MRTLEHENITSRKKKIIFTIFIFGLLFFVLNTNIVKAGGVSGSCFNFCTGGGKEPACEYTIKEDDDNFQFLCRKIGVKAEDQALCDVCAFDREVRTARVYNCCCQNDNKITNCYVGGLFGGDRTAVCACCGDCSLDDVLYIGVSIAENILKYLGVIALALFVLGGIIWITSGGSKEKVKKGVAIIKGAIIGMIIVIVAYSAVRIIMKDMLSIDKGDMPGSIPELQH